MDTSYTAALAAVLIGTWLITALVLQPSAAD